MLAAPVTKKYLCAHGITARPPRERIPGSHAESCIPIRRCRIYSCRDTCLFLARDSGNIQSTDNHCYGARIACYNEGAFPYRATGDTYADAWIGYFGTGYAIKTTITNVLFQHNTTRDCVFTNYGCSLEGCNVEVMRDVEAYNQIPIPFTPLVPTYTDKKVGVELAGDNCSIRGGLVELKDWIHPAPGLHTPTGDAAEAIWVTGNACLIETQLFDHDGVNGSIGIRAKAAVQGLTVDCTTRGFHQLNDRVIVFHPTLDPKGIDITLRISGMTTKSIDDYVDIAVGWTGKFRVINAATGEITDLVEGSAH